MSVILDFIGILAVYLHNVVVNTRHRPNYLIDFVRLPEEKENERNE